MSFWLLPVVTTHRQRRVFPAPIRSLRRDDPGRGLESGDPGRHRPIRRPSGRVRCRRVAGMIPASAPHVAGQSRHEVGAPFLSVPARQRHDNRLLIATVRSLASPVSQREWEGTQTRAPGPAWSRQLLTIVKSRDGGLPAHAELRVWCGRVPCRRPVRLGRACRRRGRQQGPHMTGLPGLRVIVQEPT